MKDMIMILVVNRKIVEYGFKKLMDVVNPLNQNPQIMKVMVKMLVVNRKHAKNGVKIFFL